MDAARMQAQLTVQQLWLQYLALGGTSDAFDLDGYLQGVLPLESFQQDVLAQALNEALADHYRAFHIPLSSSAAGEEGEVRLRRLAEELLRDPWSAHRCDPEAPGSSGS